MKRLPKCYRCGKQPCGCADGITLYHADCRDVLPLLEPGSVDLVLTDPPYGIGYVSGKEGRVARKIIGDNTTELRDWLLDFWLPRPIACFATWKCTPPVVPRGCLVWHKPTLGMGDLAFPWGNSFEMIWIYGDGWTGRRSDAVLTGKTIVTWNSGPVHRNHPHEKPADLMAQLAFKHPGDTILDPYAGSGTTGRACKDLGRKCIMVEIEEKYCDIVANRLIPHMSGTGSSGGGKIPAGPGFGLETTWKPNAKGNKDD